MGKRFGEVKRKRLGGFWKRKRERKNKCTEKYG